jgi:hypothetical protein
MPDSPTSHPTTPPAARPAEAPPPAGDAREQCTPTFLRLAAGVVYFFFGLLKLYPDLSPAELLASETLTRLTGHVFDAQTVLWWLGLAECGIGLAFLFDFKLHWVFFAFVLHQAFTFSPLLVVPELCFQFVPFAPTIEGQYILKNLISLAAGYTIMFPSVKAAWAARKARRKAE